MNHSELVNRAERWLRNKCHCRVVLTELVAYTESGEIPDAIGWVHNRSILVECKSSKNDYYADKRKRSRHPLMPALGTWRFYLTPPDILRNVTLPEGWGLYEVQGQRVVYIKGEKYANGRKPLFDSNKNSEIAMLLSALSRIHNQQINSDRADEMSCTLCGKKTGNFVCPDCAELEPESPDCDDECPAFYSDHSCGETCHKEEYIKKYGKPSYCKS